MKIKKSTVEELAKRIILRRGSSQKQRIEQGAEAIITLLNALGVEVCDE